mgnify:CR=1 FL=1
MKHPIDQEKISKNALSVISKLNKEGFEAYLVGGCIRDLLANEVPKDFDIATDAHPQNIRRIFRNSRIVGRRFQIVHVRFEREIIEVSTFRKLDPEVSDNQSDSGMILSDNSFGSLEEDSLRRDFGINALYYNPISERLIDLQEGLDDISRKRIRSIGPINLRLREDPARMLRAIRISEKLEFELEGDIKESIRLLAYLIQDVSPARLFEESLKMFMGGYGARVFLKLRELEVYKWMFPHNEPTLKPFNRELLITKALESTDQRVLKGMPITPAFIYASMLWYPFLNQRSRNIEELRLNNYDASNEAASSILSKQQLITSIPRRFSTPIKDIWFLQFRMNSRFGKKPLRTIQHKRFRAAYDFLLIREAAGEKTGDLGKWWTNYQSASDEERLNLQSNPRKKDTAPRPRK